MGLTGKEVARPQDGADHGMRLGFLDFEGRIGNRPENAALRQGGELIGKDGMQAIERVAMRLRPVGMGTDVEDIPLATIGALCVANRGVNRSLGRVSAPFSPRAA